MRFVQQLLYREGKFYCPAHGTAGLQNISIAGIDEPTKYGVMCLSDVEGLFGAMPCGNSAEWETNAAMNKDLQEHAL